MQISDDSRSMPGASEINLMLILSHLILLVVLQWSPDHQPAALLFLGKLIACCNLPGMVEPQPEALQPLPAPPATPGLVVPSPGYPNCHCTSLSEPVWSELLIIIDKRKLWSLAQGSISGGDTKYLKTWGKGKTKQGHKKWSQLISNSRYNVVIAKSNPFLSLAVLVYV